jgi:hypothetical protein
MNISRCGIRRHFAIFDGKNPGMRRESDETNVIRRDEKRADLRDMRRKKKNRDPRRQGVL